MTVFHPILPTDSQRLASDPESSAWVSANAGSGKTHVLVNRIARLLLQGAEPARIVCLTFTKAAAAEMERRLFRTLGEWTGLDDFGLTSHLAALTGREQSPADVRAARRLFATALETPGGLHIQTIHAFCERLLQRFPVEAGAVPGFQIIDERLQHQLLAAAQEAVLAGTEESIVAAAATIARHLTAAGFGRLLTELLAHRETIALYGREEIRKQILAAALDVAPGDSLASFARDVTRALDRAAYAMASAQIEANDCGRSLLPAIQGLLAASSAEEQFNRLHALFLTKNGAPRSKSTFPPRQLWATSPAAAEFLENESARLAPLFERARRIGVYEATSALLALAAPILGRYEAAKRALGYFDYDDLIHRTLSLLSDPETASWVLYKLDGGIDHLLIDEAQDTSRRQWQIIQGITGEFFAGEGARSGLVRTLFVVGDEKQCIFAFQGADPDAFAEMRGDFAARTLSAGGGVAEVGLTISFRSTKAILEVVDRVFPDVVHEASRATAPGKVELWPLETRDVRRVRDAWRAPLTYDFSEHPRRKLALRIAGEVRRWIAAKEPLSGRGRAIHPGDILILVRHRTTLMDELVRALKKEGLPVSGADRLTLITNIAVMDLLALGHAVLLPLDDQMLACVLKSPLVERDDGRPLGDDDLLLLASARGRRTLWQRLEAAVGEGRPYRGALERLKKWREEAGHRTPFEFFAGVLAADGGRERFIARLGSQCGEPLDAFLSQCLDHDASQAASLSGFLDWVESVDTVLKRDMEQGADEVRVMTVHGAKGLEANIVILADTCEVPARRKDPNILAAAVEHSAGHLSVPLWRVKSDKDASLIAELRHHARTRDMAEYERLLYVAMTRARDRLYICGFANGTAETLPLGCWYRRIAPVLQEIGTSRIDPEGRVIWSYEGIEPGAGESPEGETDKTPFEPLPEWIDALPGAPAPDVAELQPSRQDGRDSAEAVLPPLRDGADSDRARGAHIHRLLEEMPGLDPAAREAVARRYLAMPGHGLDAGSQKDILASDSGGARSRRLPRRFLAGRTG